MDDRKTMPLKQAQAVLREYPDADLRAFKIIDKQGRECDADGIAIMEVGKSLSAISSRIKGKGRL